MRYTEPSNEANTKQKTNLKATVIPQLNEDDGFFHDFYAVLRRVLSARLDIWNIY